MYYYSYPNDIIWEEFDEEICMAITSSIYVPGLSIQSIPEAKIGNLI